MVDSGKPELVTVVRNSRENSAGAGHKILISEGGLIVLGEGGGREVIFGENKKFHNCSIKDNYFNVL